MTELELIKKYDNLFTSQLAKGDKVVVLAMEDLERKLFDALNDFILEFQTINSRLTFSLSNISRAAEFERVWQAFQGDVYQSITDNIVPQVDAFFEIAYAYFDELGLPATTIANQIKPLIFGKVGISTSGELITGGFLQGVAKMDIAREQVKNIVLGAVASKTSLSQLKADLKSSVIGTAKQQGALLKNYNTYAFDLFNQVHELANIELAEQLNLQYFIYQGSIKDTTRPFCEKRAGKVFSTADAKKWVNDPNLTAVRNKATYNPLIDRGGYRCRHWIRYISEDAAISLGYQKQ